MEIQLKSNGQKSTVTKDTWDKMSKDTKRSYVILNHNEVQTASNTADNTVKKAEDTSKNKVEDKTTVKTDPKNKLPDTGDASEGEKVK